MAILRAHPWRVGSVARFVHNTRYRLSRGSFDRIDAHWALPCAWPIAISASATKERDRGVVLNVISHGSDVRLLATLPFPLRHHIAKSIARRAKEWRFVSSSLLEDFLRKLDRQTRITVERVGIVLPAPIEMPDVTARAEQLRRDHSAFGVVVGRLVASKRVDAVIRHVKERGPAEPLFVIGDGPERERLRALAQDAGIDGRFLGEIARPEALAWIAAASCMYFASSREGYSTVLREADHLGTTVRHIP